MSEERTSDSPHRTLITVVTSAPATTVTRTACLVVIYGDDLGRRVPLGTDTITLGRSTKSDVQIDQESISRNHCTIWHSGRSYAIKDMGSTNGTYVNDELVEEMHLRDGDQIKIGRTILKFITGDNIEAQYHEEIYRLMTIDGLTEISNKRFFQEMIEKEASRCQRYDRIFSLVLFDIDAFKDINDTHGHLAGDTVLRQLGALTKSRVRRDDVLARIGGDEFAIILPEVSGEGAAGLAKSIQVLVEQSLFQFEGTRIDLTISLGVAQWEPGVENAEALIKRADDKLYEAKRNGRNQVRV